MIIQPGLPGFEWSERRIYGGWSRTEEGRLARRRASILRYHAAHPYQRVATPQKRGRKPLPEEERRRRATLRRKKWGERNREYLNMKIRERRKANPERRKAAYRRRHANPVQILSSAMRSSIRRAFTVKKLRSDKDARSWEALVGYTAHELIIHIEKQFRSRMSWQNFGDWHVDHIVPVSSFKFQSVTDLEFRACWALTNLRPIWARANREKAALRKNLL